MKSVSLSAYSRTQTRRKGARTTRANERIPAVIYGRHIKPESLEVTEKDLENLIHHSASEIMLVDLAVEGGKGTRLALVKDVQHHPLTQKVLHLDLMEVRADEKVIVMVPVESTGEPAGVKTGGGTLEHVLFKLKVRALPKDLPEVIIVDVASLEVGKSIHIGEITPPAGVELMGDAKIPVFSVAAPLTEEQEAAAVAAEGGAAAQPEMIKEKKEEGAAPAAGAKDAKAAAPAAADKGGDKKAAEKKK